MAVTSTEFLAVIIAAVINLFIGAAWYSNTMFGTQWRKLTKTKSGDEGHGAEFGVALLASIVAAFFLAVIIDALGVTDIGGGAVVGGIAWLGFVATTTLNHVLWERRPLALYTINNLHYVVSFTIMGAIIAAA